MKSAEFTSDDLRPMRGPRRAQSGLRGDCPPAAQELGHLDNAGLRELVTVGDVVLLAFDDGIGLLPLDGIIIQQP